MGIAAALLTKRLKPLLQRVKRPRKSGILSTSSSKERSRAAQKPGILDLGPNRLGGGPDSGSRLLPGQAEVLGASLGYFPYPGAAAAKEYGFNKFITYGAGAEVSFDASQIAMDILVGKPVKHNYLSPVELFTADQMFERISEGMLDGFWSLAKIPMDYLKNYYK